MWIYIVRRLVWLPFLVFFVSFITFTLFRVVPGDPVVVMLGNRYDPDSAVTKNLRRELGLDRPFHIQYGTYMWGFIRGDFGESIRFRGQPVRDIIFPKMWISAQVLFSAMIISVGLGLPLGFYVAHKQGAWQDPTVVTSALFLTSVPILVSIPILLRLFCLQLDWIPCSGWGGFFDPRIVVPALALGVPGVAGLTRLMRASTLDVLGQDFIRTAHSKGLSQLRVDTRHVLRNALIPIVTVLAFALVGLIGGTLIAERLLGIPGIAQFTFDSISNRDYPVVMAVTLIGAGTFVLANLLADLTYAFVDPRIRYQ
jgi:peptide/nickel transport system permease protein